MASTRYHVRSISLPSRSHPSILRIEEKLNKLKAWEASSTSSSGSICIGLSGLEELYKCMDDLLNMASTQEILSRNQNEKSLDELLDDSVRFLDVCSIARDIMLRFKEQVQCLQSALRRRNGHLTCESNIANYTCFRKKMKKDAKKLIAELKQMDKLGASQILDQDHHLCAVIRVFQEVNLMNSSIFQSLLLFLSTPVSKRKQSRWLLVSKLMHKGVIACEGKEENVNEVESVDSALSEGSNFQKLQIAPKRLEALEIKIEGLENCLEQVFRPLIKTRASLLNIISQ